MARGFYYLGLPTSAPVSPGGLGDSPSGGCSSTRPCPPRLSTRPSGSGPVTSPPTRWYGSSPRPDDPWMAATDELYLAPPDAALGWSHRDRGVPGPPGRQPDARRPLHLHRQSPRATRQAQLTVPEQAPARARRRARLLPVGRSAPARGLRPPVDAELRPADRDDTPQGPPEGRAAASADETRPPAGGEILAGKVVEHWRGNPTTWSRSALSTCSAPGWLEALRRRGRHPRPAPSRSWST